MKKGYEGEELFDSLVKEIVEAIVLVLNDLVLTISEQTVQIDSLIVTAEKAYLYEIKNYKGGLSDEVRSVADFERAGNCESDNPVKTDDFFIEAVISAVEY